MYWKLEHTVKHHFRVMTETYIANFSPERLSKPGANTYRKYSPVHNFPEKQMLTLKKRFCREYAIKNRLELWQIVLHPV